MTSALEYKLEVVVLPVSDVDQALAFYVDQVGFDGNAWTVQQSPGWKETDGNGAADGA